MDRRRTKIKAGAKTVFFDWFRGKHSFLFNFFWKRFAKTDQYKRYEEKIQRNSGGW